MSISNKIQNHIDTFFKVTSSASFTCAENSIVIDEWFTGVLTHLIKIKSTGRNLFFIGNGASASISAHFATDFTKNGLIPSFSNTEGAMLTCFSNDYSYEEAYMEMLKRLMKNGDGLIAISSSGTSKNIINAAEFVRQNLKDSPIITFTGFNENNPLRKMGNYNLYINSCEYSFAESCHAYYLHLLTDLYCHNNVEQVPENISMLLKP